MINYLKIGKASDLSGGDRLLYRSLEIIPGFLSWITLLGLLIFSYFKPTSVAFFIIAFDIYWLLLVIFLGIHLVAAYKRMKRNLIIDWEKKCEDLNWKDIYHLVIFPTSNESLEVIRTSFEALLNDGYPQDRMIAVLAIEGRCGKGAQDRAEKIKVEFGHKFKHFLITVHPDNIVGEIKGKGSNQAWAAKKLKEDIIDPNGYDYENILVSVLTLILLSIPVIFIV